jgi:hypothetical protein
MNYIKIFRGSDSEVEERANAYLSQLDEKGHRVMATFGRLSDDEARLLIVVNDQPRTSSPLSRP